jgi:hypothetical protein
MVSRRRGFAPVCFVSDIVGARGVCIGRCPDWCWGMVRGGVLGGGQRPPAAVSAAEPHRPANRQRTDYDVVTYLPR